MQSTADYAMLVTKRHRLQRDIAVRGLCTFVMTTVRRCRIPVSE